MLNFKGSKIERYWHELFEYTILIKGIIGAIETISGFLAIFVRQAEFYNIYAMFSGDELTEHPRDYITTVIVQALQNLSFDVKLFLGLYFILHGLLDIFLMIQLYRDKIWAYMFTIIVMLVFVLYQLYEIIFYHSIFMIIFTIFDLFLISLILHEYKEKKLKKINL